ncbi:hypothetical protein ACQKP3_08695 [Vibrio sp. DNB22_10_4]|jgi:hypothetical protein
MTQTSNSTPDPQNPQQEAPASDPQAIDERHAQRLLDAQQQATSSSEPSQMDVGWLQLQAQLSHVTDSIQQELDSVTHTLNQRLQSTMTELNKVHSTLSKVNDNLKD